jgi:hypothetical protein
MLKKVFGDAQSPAALSADPSVVLVELPEILIQGCRWRAPIDQEDHH